jgi:hypothetical protein
MLSPPICHPLRAEGQTPASAWSSLRRTCGHPSDRDFPRNQTFCGCKMSRTVGGGVLKGCIVGAPLSGALLVLFFRHRKKSTWNITREYSGIRVTEIRSPHPSRFACHLLQRRRQGSGFLPLTLPTLGRRPNARPRVAVAPTDMRASVRPRLSAQSDILRRQNVAHSRWRDS